jgi:hypothetical protein
MRLPFRDDVKIITAHRQPTPGEIRFGEGATHYKDFSVELWKDKDGLPKRWIKCIEDGLRYYRPSNNCREY